MKKPSTPPGNLHQPSGPDDLDPSDLKFGSEMTQMVNICPNQARAPIYAPLS